MLTMSRLRFVDVRALIARHLQTIFFYLDNQNKVRYFYAKKRYLCNKYDKIGFKNK